jgi:hypothetical protein
MLSSRLVSWAFSGVVFISGCGGATQPQSEQRDTDSSEGGQAENGSSLGGKSFNIHTGGKSTKSSLASTVQGEGGNDGARTSIIAAGGTNAGGTSSTSSVGGTSSTSSVGGTSSTSSVGGTSSTSNVGGTSSTSNVGGTSSTSNVGGTSSTTTTTIGCLFLSGGANFNCYIDYLSADTCNLYKGLIVSSCPPNALLTCPAEKGSPVGTLFFYDARAVESLMNENSIDPCRSVTVSS